MRAIRFGLAIVVGLCLMLVISANMRPVDLHLAPKALGVDAINFTDVPLAVVIVGSVLVGIALGLLIEFFREAKHRAQLAEKRQQVAKLQAENNRLSRELGVEVEDLPILAG